MSCQICQTSRTFVPLIVYMQIRLFTPFLYYMHALASLKMFLQLDDEIPTFTPLPVTAFSKIPTGEYQFFLVLFKKKNTSLCVELVNAACCLHHGSTHGTETSWLDCSLTAIWIGRIIVIWMVLNLHFLLSKHTFMILVR